MLISQVIQRLQELQRLASDIEVQVQDDTGQPVDDYWFELVTLSTGITSVRICRSVKKEVNTKRHTSR